MYEMPNLWCIERLLMTLLNEIQFLPGELGVRLGRPASLQLSKRTPFFSQGFINVNY
jgi:hypothetical protein